MKPIQLKPIQYLKGQYRRYFRKSPDESMPKGLAIETIVTKAPEFDTPEEVTLFFDAKRDDIFNDHYDKVYDLQLELCKSLEKNYHDREKALAKFQGEIISQMKSFDEARPIDGEIIEARFPDGEWRKVTYYEDGIDGILEDEQGDITEIEEYGQEMVWRTINNQLSDFSSG